MLLFHNLTEYNLTETLISAAAIIRSILAYVLIDFSVNILCSAAIINSAKLSDIDRFYTAFLQAILVAMKRHPFDKHVQISGR